MVEVSEFLIIISILITTIGGILGRISVLFVENLLKNKCLPHTWRYDPNYPNNKDMFCRICNKIKIGEIKNE